MSSSSSCCNKPGNKLKSSCEMISSSDKSSVRDAVQNFYGSVLNSSQDLKTNFCLTPISVTNKHGSTTFRNILKEIHPKVVDKYYGCGVAIPECIVGSSILDLGSGSGRDCFVLSKLVGQEGQVTGVDMTDEQLDVAQQYIQYHTDHFGYKTPNVSFVKGFIEKLTEAGIRPNTYDVVISNCVINLSPNKQAVLQETYKCLKEGGELFFSDIYADRRIDNTLQNNELLWVECASGALYWKDLIRYATEIGFSEPRLVAAHRWQIGHNNEVAEAVGDVQFVSATYRLFKLPVGGAWRTGTATYRGTIVDYPGELPFDYNTRFKTNEATPLDGAAITFLSVSRYRQHFTIEMDQQANTEIEKYITVNPFKVTEQNVL